MHLCRKCRVQKIKYAKKNLQNIHTEYLKKKKKNKIYKLLFHITQKCEAGRRVLRKIKNSRASRNTNV